MSAFDQTPLIEWQHEQYTVRLYATGKQDEYGKHELAYRLFDGDQLLFEGERFCPAPHINPASERTVYELLFFLTLDPRENDPELFEKYTPAQKAWAVSRRAELLRWHVEDYLEELENEVHE
jgi:hypothetical protein